MEGQAIDGSVIELHTRLLGACRRNARARAMRRVQMRGGARGPHARRTPCTSSVRPRAPTKQMGLLKMPDRELMAEPEEERHLKLSGEFDCAPEPLPIVRHSTSHVMAQAVKRLFPDVKLAIGPAIADGFYYDFLKPAPFTPEDLERVEST